MFASRVEVVEEIKWNGEDRVEFTFKGGSGWCGAKRKDFWNPDNEWEKIIKPGCQIRLWTVQYSTAVGFEVWMFDPKSEGFAWCSVWCVTNNFEKKAERHKMDVAYNNFIKREGLKISELIDRGKNLKEIDKLIDGGHTGNTYACALAIGIKRAKNRKNAQKIRKEHNEEWGVKDSKGLVNPAVLTITTK